MSSGAGSSASSARRGSSVNIMMNTPITIRICRIFDHYITVKFIQPCFCSNIRNDEVARFI